MKKMSKLFVIALAAVFMFGMVACGDGTGDTGDEEFYYPLTGTVTIKESPNGLYVGELLVAEYSKPDEDVSFTWYGPNSDINVAKKGTSFTPDKPGEYIVVAGGTYVEEGTEKEAKVTIEDAPDYFAYFGKYTVVYEITAGDVVEIAELQKSSFNFDTLYDYNGESTDHFYFTISEWVSFTAEDDTSDKFKITFEDEGFQSAYKLAGKIKENEGYTGFPGGKGGTAPNYTDTFFYVFFCNEEDDSDPENVITTLTFVRTNLEAETLAADGTPPKNRVYRKL